MVKDLYKQYTTFVTLFMKWKITTP